jgi:hypothetical protein
VGRFAPCSNCSVRGEFEDGFDFELDCKTRCANAFRVRGEAPGSIPVRDD